MNILHSQRIDGAEAVAPTKKDVKEVPMTKEGLKNPLTIDELRKHDKAESPWFVVNGEVYDGTKFLEAHPGGAQSIISAAGLDATDEFMAIRMYFVAFNPSTPDLYRFRDSESHDA